MNKLVLAAALLVPFSSYAADKPHDHHAMHGQAAEAGGNPAVKEYMQGMETMHKGMDIKYTGNADVDFVQGMIPHHQGAVAMAKTELKYGTDPELHKLAEDIIRSQEQEIKFMKEWLEKNKK